MATKRRTNEDALGGGNRSRAGKTGRGRAAKRPNYHVSTTPSAETAPPDKKAALMRPKELCDYLSVSRTALHFLHEKDPTFPRKIVLTAGIVGWRRSSIDNWLEQRERGA